MFYIVPAFMVLLQHVIRLNGSLSNFTLRDPIYIYIYAEETGEVVHPVPNLAARETVASETVA